MKQVIAIAFVFTAFLLVPSAASAQPTPPPEWTCDALFFGAGPEDGCDCGCGAADPDCVDATTASCTFSNCARGQVPTAADPTACAANECNDGYVGGTEFCDDGGGAGCAADCSAIDEGFACGFNGSGCHPLVCGDGIVDGDERCEDGNAASGDGCAACVVEDGFSCGFDGLTCHPIVCNDGIIEGSEDCDDGNVAAGDGCSAACVTEAGFSCSVTGEPCIAVPADWICDPGYFSAGDGCDCGCGVLDPDCVGGGCAESGCDDGDVCAFCYVDGESVGCADPAEGEGEGEGEGEDAGEGEGEGNGLTDGPKTNASGCAAVPLDSSAAFALLVVTIALVRRRRR